MTTATMIRTVDAPKVVIHREPKYNPQPGEKAHVDRLLALANGKTKPKP